MSSVKTLLAGTLLGASLTAGGVYGYAAWQRAASPPPAPAAAAEATLAHGTAPDKGMDHNNMGDMAEMPGMASMDHGTPPPDPHAGHGGLRPSPAAALPGYSVVQVTPERQQAIGVRTGRVEQRPLRMDIRTVGVVELDQTRQSEVHPRVSGWVTKVYGGYVGQDVRRGQPLLELNSPELIATQEEYLIALQAGELPGMAGTRRQLVDAARRRLELWGVGPGEIATLTRTRQVRRAVVVRSPVSGQILERAAVAGTYVEPSSNLFRLADLSTVWLQAKAYEHELPHIEVGQPVRVTLPARPGVAITGRVAFIEPTMQEATRTAKVRVVLPNSGSVLKPGMFADLWVSHGMGQGLLVPESAVIRTGERALVFRVLPGDRFEPVQVKLGSRFGDRLQVVSGLRPGDELVTSGNFLIDADSRLQSATSGMGGHRH